MFRFFPAGGYRDLSSGDPFGRGFGGWYWSSSTVDDTRGWYARVNHSSTDVDIWRRTLGFSVRCVAQSLGTTYCFYCFFVFNFQFSLFNFQLNCCVAQKEV